MIPELLAFWQGKFARCSNIVILNVIPHFLHGAFGERNAKKFKGWGNFVLNLKLLFLKSIFKWVNASGLFYLASMLKMLDSCTFSTYCWCTSSIHPEYMGFAPSQFYYLFIFKYFQ